MGTYTEFYIDVDLKKYPMIQNILTDMLHHWNEETGEMLPTPENLPNHPLFQAARWRYMLTCCYADFSADFSLKETNEMLHLFVHSAFKDYDDEIDKFLDFISPYIVSMGPIGFYHTEGMYRPIILIKAGGGDIVELIPELADGEEIDQYTFDFPEYKRKYLENELNDDIQSLLEEAKSD